MLKPIHTKSVMRLDKNSYFCLGGPQLWSVQPLSFVFYCKQAALQFLMLNFLIGFVSNLSLRKIVAAIFGNFFQCLMFFVQFSLFFFPRIIMFAFFLFTKNIKIYLQKINKGFKTSKISILNNFHLEIFEKMAIFGNFRQLKGNFPDGQFPI